MGTNVRNWENLDFMPYKFNVFFTPRTPKNLLKMASIAPGWIKLRKSMSFMVFEVCIYVKNKISCQVVPPPRLSRVKGGNSSTCFYVSREPVPETTHTIKETHPVPILRFCFNLTTFLSLWYRKFTFWYYSQNIVNIFYPTQNWHQIGCSSLSWNTRVPLVEGVEGAHQVRDVFPLESDNSKLILMFWLVVPLSW